MGAGAERKRELQTVTQRGVQRQRWETETGWRDRDRETGTETERIA